jgi:hypothetical protein
VAYDEDLANRIRELIAGEPGVTEKKMFGGLAFLIGGNMSVALAAKPHAEVAVMRGRPMTGWLRIGPEGLKTKRQLERWVARGVAYAKTLPAKS